MNTTLAEINEAIKHTIDKAVEEMPIEETDQDNHILMVENKIYGMCRVYTNPVEQFNIYMQFFYERLKCQ